MRAQAAEHRQRINQPRKWRAAGEREVAGARVMRRLHMVGGQTFDLRGDLLRLPPGAVDEPVT